MLSYCLKCRKNTESKNLKVIRTKNRGIKLLSKCEVGDSKKSNFIKEQEASGLLSSLGIKTTLSKTPLVVNLFKSTKQVNTRYKMNETADKSLLAGDKFVSEMPGNMDLHILLAGHLQKKKERLQKFKEVGDSQYILSKRPR